VSLRGKNVVVTGAANGIGRALAMLAVAEGAELLLVDVQEASLTALAEQIGGRAHTMDVGDAGAWDALAASSGRWDLVFLNAGIMSAAPDAPLDAANFVTLDLARYRRILAVNVDGVAFGLRTAIPRMREHGGSIVVTASAAGLVPYPLDPAYSMTKHALVGLVRSVAPTLVAGDGPALRLSAICPGGVATELVPEAVRSGALLMEPAVLAAEAIDLALHGANGEVRAKLKADAPAEAMHPPTLDLR